MQTMSTNVAEAFLRGVHIAKGQADEEERFVTILDPEPGRGNVWQLTPTEFQTMRRAVMNLLRFMRSACGDSRQPLPSRESVANLKHWGHGVRFWFSDEGDNAEEMQYSALEYCVRHDPLFGFDDGDTIAEASSHSDAELWADVIVPAIEVGLIEVTVWGEPLR